MGVGRAWSTGHGREFEILARSLATGDGGRITAFRQALTDGQPIMVARAVIHEGVPLDRFSSAGAPLDPWVPAVTQYRWYDPGARFWIDSGSTPYQMDLIMRAALLDCCDLWFEGYRQFQICGICERPAFRIRRFAEAVPGPVELWVEVPDHWGSDDRTGHDGEGRAASGFQTWTDTDDVRPGGVLITRDARGRRPVKGGTFAEDGGVGPDTFVLFEWSSQAKAPAVPPQRRVDPVPSSEQRRVERLARLAAQQVVGEWSGPAAGAVASTGLLAVGSVGAAVAPVAGEVAAPADPGQHGAPLIPSADLEPITEGQGLYGRLFPPAPAPDGLRAAALRQECTEIARLMLPLTDDPIRPVGERDEQDNPFIPAIHTYFGQFVDHDLSFDPSSLRQRITDPARVVDFRTPRLDLDSIYGRGPRDQPYLYDGAGRFLLGDDVTFDQTPRPDLPRNRRGQAVIADPRNDQNRIISQLTALFLRFHNAVADGALSHGQPLDFSRARRLVQWHYQWLVLQHFLPAVVGDQKAAAYLWAAGGPPVSGPDLVRALSGQLRVMPPTDRPWGPSMPVELSAAVFRFGHSMVRSAYAVNGVEDGGMPIRMVGDDRLLGGRPLTAGQAVDWRYFVPGLPPRPGDTTPLPQPSYLIDTQLNRSFGRLAGGLLPADDAVPASLPERTLLRGLQLRLPSGQAVAAELRQLGYTDVHPLTPSEVGLGDRLAATHTPLWFYVLKEAELARGGYRLGPLGGTLVAELLVSMLVSDPTSFLHQAWTPEGGDFTLADLVTVAESWQPPPL